MSASVPSSITLPKPSISMTCTMTASPSRRGASSGSRTSVAGSSGSPPTRRAPPPGGPPAPRPQPDAAGEGGRDGLEPPGGARDLDRLGHAAEALRRRDQQPVVRPHEQPLLLRRAP